MKKLIAATLLFTTTAVSAGPAQNFITAQENGRLGEAYLEACGGDTDCMVTQAGAMKAIIRNVEDGKIRTTRMTYCLDKYSIGPNKMPDMSTALYSCVYN